MNDTINLFDLVPLESNGIRPHKFGAVQLESLVNEEADMKLVAEASSGREAVELY